MFCGHNCNYDICNYVLYCTEVCSHLIMSYHNKVSSHGSTHSYIFGWYADVLWGQQCNYNICNYVLYRGLRPPGNVFYHNKVSSYRSTHSYFGWYTDVLWAQLAHSFNQVVDRVLLCGHLIIHTVSIHHLHTSNL